MFARVSRNIPSGPGADVPVRVPEQTEAVHRDQVARQPREAALDTAGPRQLVQL